MAKARPRLKPIDPLSAPPAVAANQTSNQVSMPRWAVGCRRIAAATFGGLLVYGVHFPSDSVLVESGDALWFCAISLLLWTMTMVSEPFRNRARSIDKRDQLGTMLDVLVWVLAAWMMLAALASCPPGNLRQATNEAWVWVAGAALLTACRRLIVDRQSQAMTLTLLCAAASGTAALALHQEWISLPAIKAQYLANPEAVLRAAGVDAPPRSASRMVFANRLLDGGPTATFALANSLAALLVVAVLVPLGILRATDRRQPGSLAVMISLSLLVACAVAALFATRSRSALLACLLAVGWIWFEVGGRNRSGAAGRSPTLGPAQWFWPLARFWPAVKLMIWIATATLAGLLIFGDDEWMAAAPASLEFRLQYWKSTAQLLLEHPVFGCGPGGFQAMYLGYRLPIANESIADPHNFFVETLAAGGFLAGLLLLLILWVGLRLQRSDLSADALLEIPADRPQHAQAQHAQARCMLMGAGGALVAIRLFGLLSANFIDFQADVIATLIAVGACWFAHAGLGSINAMQLRVIASGIILAIMIHLTVAGGWTVPGVAMVVWIVAAMLCVTNDSTVAQLQTDSLHPTVTGKAKRWSFVFLVVGITLLATLRLESISPVQTAQLAIGRADAAARRGFDSRVETDSRLAIDADVWAFDAALWRSEYLKSRLISSGDDPQLRRQWHESLTSALERAGDHPIVRRAAGEQFLHLYQRFGRFQDLQDADHWIRAALNGNPTDLSLVAQAAMIALARDDRPRAESLARQSIWLSELGNNVVRLLGLQQILVVEHLGAAATERPLLRPALDEFRDRLGLPDEPPAAPQRSKPSA